MDFVFCEIETVG